MGTLLQIKDLTTQFFTEEGVVHAVDGVTYDVQGRGVVGRVGPMPMDHPVAGADVDLNVAPDHRARKHEKGAVEVRTPLHSSSARIDDLQRSSVGGGQ